MGIKEVFGEESKWEMSDTIKGISEIKQQTKLVVNEQGIKAATATKKLDIT